MSLILDGTNGLSDVDGSAATPAIRGTDTNTGIYFGNDVIGFSEGGTQCGEFDASANFKFNSGYGSVATAYGCRAWVNFNGMGTVAIRGSGNVSSITDNGEGDYTVNFTNAMPDANYAALATANQNLASNPAGISVGYPNNSSTVLYSTTQVRFLVKFGSGTEQLDPQNFSAAIFR